MPKTEQADELELLEFYASWCAPCQLVSPVLDELSHQFEGKIRIVRVDVDVDPHSVEQYSVYSLPTIVFLRKGREVNRIVGAKDKDHYYAAITASL